MGRLKVSQNTKTDPFPQSFFWVWQSVLAKVRLGMVYCSTNLLLESPTEKTSELPECLSQWSSVLSQLPSLWLPKLILWRFSFVLHQHETNWVVRVNKTIQKILYYVATLCDEANWKRRKGACAALKAEGGVSSETCHTQEDKSEAFSSKRDFVIHVRATISYRPTICQKTVILDSVFFSSFSPENNSMLLSWLLNAYYTEKERLRR